MRSIYKLCVASLLSLIGTLLLADEGTDGISISLQADDLVIVQAGEKIYHAHCAACHGANLEGQPDWQIRDANGFLPAPPHDATGHTWHHSDDLLFEITKYGPSVVINDSSYRTTMPVYKDILSDDEIIAVLSFIKNTWPEEQRSWQEEVNGTQHEGFKVTPKTNSSLIDKLLK
ncbi:MAG: cytochrome c [Gammaproteobacteria bacterium]|nr:cytochrome c [Gammaproteobacteria bacterium]